MTVVFLTVIDIPNKIISPDQNIFYFIKNMKNSHPIYGISISSEILDCLLEEFEEFINSKRSRSRISTIADLIDVLCKRNVFFTDAQHVTDIIHKYLPSGVRDTIQSYINSINHNKNVSGNSYGTNN